MSNGQNFYPPSAGGDGCSFQTAHHANSHPNSPSVFRDMERKGGVMVEWVGGEEVLAVLGGGKVGWW